MILKFFKKRSLKKYIQKLETQLDNTLVQLGKEAFEKFPHLPMQYDIPVSQYLEYLHQIENHIQSYNKNLNEKLEDYIKFKKDYERNQSEMREKVIQLKNDLKQAKLNIKEYEKKFKAKLAIENEKAKKFKVLTILQDKFDFQKTLLNLKETLESNISNKETFEKELDSAQRQMAQSKQEWEKLDHDLQNDIKKLKDEHSGNLKTKDSIQGKISTAFKDLGLKIDEEKVYTKTLVSYEKKLEDIKTAINQNQKILLAL